MKKSITYITIIFVLIFNSLISQEEIVTLKTATGDIEGTLNVPKETKQFAVVLIISGSGPTDRNGNQELVENNSLKFFSDELCKNGIGSIRFDKRGIAKSREAATEEINLRFDTYVEDVVSWVNFISKDKRITKIIIAGHSEGSLIGMIAANKNKKVNGYISISGAGRPADEILKEQLSKVSSDAKESIYSMIDQLKKGDTLSNVPVIFYSLFRPSVQPYMISWFKYNPQNEIKKLTIPALIIQGTTDIQVSEKDAELLEKANPNAELKIINNMNHVLKYCETKDKEKQIPIYSNPELPLHKDLIPITVEFIQKMQ